MGHTQKPPLLLVRRPHNGLKVCAAYPNRATRPPIDGRSGGASPKKPTNSPKLGQEPLSSGPKKGLCPSLGALPEGRFKKIGTCYHSPQKGMVLQMIRQP
jgi:hypothetical protein